MPDDHNFKNTLYTVDERGHRKWVYSSLIKGQFYKYRLVVAYFLMAVYLCMPWITIGGSQAVLINFLEGKFAFFGITLVDTDTIYLVMLFFGAGMAMFFFTAIFGRVWCGWACPETVFLEFMFRPIERWVEGSAAQREKLDRGPWTLTKIRKKLLKHGLCAVFAWIIASTALAYVLGREPLLEMMTDWPHKNPWPFGLTVVMMGLMAFQFGWFREQFCTVVCPYARFQSVLMDADSLTVCYDPERGEPRGKYKKGENNPEKGDCVDCGLCVRVCPTGIDIRNGLQLECVACTSCIDACDSIMDKLDKPRGLVRYSTENALEGMAFKLIRPRVLVYGFLLIAVSILLAYSVASRDLGEFHIIRGAVGIPYSVRDDGKITNRLHVRISNKSKQERTYTLTAPREPDVEVVMAGTPIPVKPGEVKQNIPVFISFPAATLTNGKRRLIVQLEDNVDYRDTLEITLLGPEK